MSNPAEERPASERPMIDPVVAKVMGAVALLVAVAAVAAFSFLRGTNSPPPDAAAAANPVLKQGREVFLSRCASCHGETGKGDGPIARGVPGPPPGDLTDDQWKHGGKPSEVMDVIANGVPGTGMSGFGKYRILDAAEIRAVAAYVFHLAGREVPAEFSGPCDTSSVPPALAADPLLAQGHELYMARCANCHGEKGRGDGPIARSVPGPPPGDLSDDRWKHGGKPAEVVEVITNGVPATGMSGFGKYRILDAAEIRAVAAYVFHLSGREVPAELRAP